MFYNTRLNNHNLPFNPFKSCIVPRPIGWISSLSKQGIVNLAPYSYFNAVADIPPIVMFASSPKADSSDKDSLRNIEENGEFVVNIASYHLREQVQLSSNNLAHDVSEADHFSIKTVPSNLVKPPRVKQALISLECQYLKTIDLEVEGKKASSKIILGHVVGIYIDDLILSDGKIDIAKLKPIARLGYNEYAVITEIFKMERMA
jgi:flavin reductase (DIM6/NTAB) family NADH-FMN oxidoreductase RutF